MTNRVLMLSAALAAGLISCCKAAPEVSSKESNKTPESFAVRLVTTKGDIIIDVHRDWSPNGADRFFDLVEQKYYTDVAFFRVIDGFMAQAGISGDPALNEAWQEKGIPDDPVKQRNARGTVTFAQSSRPGSRTTQFFINLVDNPQLDTMRFAPFGKVRDMTAVDQLYKGYGEGAPSGSGPNQMQLRRNGNAYLEKEFPNLDYIKSAAIVK
jgi:peptidyl-prolyl cis-trans isomerase A (cyclophilin A)